MTQNSLTEFVGLKCSRFFGPSATMLAVVLNILLVGCFRSGDAPPVAAPHATQKIYTTKFPLAENPISEGGNWINGGTVGLDWSDVRTTSGLAFGTESGSGGYDDSTAVLTGNWKADQMAQAVVHSVNQNSNIFEEVELRLRTTITAHSITGYEINFRCTSDASRYVQIVRWNGPLGSFNYVNTTPGPGIHDGDLVTASIIGSTLSVYINNKLVLRGTDRTYTDGNPGIGFFLRGPTGVNGDYGFTSFTAMDSLTSR
jgi:hypothetical protein